MAARRPVLAFFAAALVVVVLSGCGTATGGAEDPEPSEKTEGSTGASDDDGVVGPEPPGSTLSYGRETVRAELGSYCWTSACADSFAIPVGRETLSVPAGSTLTFAYGGRELESLSVTAHPVGQGNHLKRTAGDVFLVPDDWDKGYREIDLPVHRSGTRAHIATDLGVGEYVIAAFARMPQGDALYGFHIAVE